MFALIALIAIIVGGIAVAHAARGHFQFVILGDRTGGALPGVYEQAWREAAADHPAFVITVGDTIEGGSDLTMDAEWGKIMAMLAPYRRYRIFFTPGNHDVWSIASAQAFEKYTKNPLHYSFDYEQVHFTVLDNSRSDSLPAEELAYLEKDLEKHQKQPIKFVFSHRPSWILQAIVKNPEFALQRLAKRYGVQYVVAGHIHEMLHYEVDGVTYISIASSGGHLRGNRQYTSGWFFQHTLVTVDGNSVKFTIKELGQPFGEGLVTTLSDWGGSGLIAKKGG